MTRGSTFHLKVITQSAVRMDASKTRIRRFARPAQLSFPFLDPSAVFILNIGALDGSDIIETLHRTKPRWIFDVRVHPRLDLIAGSRVSAFKTFAKMHTVYVDVFGRIGVTDYRSAEINPAFWMGTLSDILANSELRAGPYILFMDHSALIEASAAAIDDALYPVLGRRVSTSIISSEDQKIP